MRKANTDLREKMRSKGVFLWQVSDVLNKSEGWLCKLLRKELDGASKQLILDAIDRASIKFNENV